MENSHHQSLILHFLFRSHYKNIWYRIYVDTSRVYSKDSRFLKRHYGSFLGSGGEVMNNLISRALKKYKVKKKHKVAMMLKVIHF